MAGPSGGEPPRDAGPDERAAEHPWQEPDSAGRRSAEPTPFFQGKAHMWRFAGAGMELGGSSLVFAAIGYGVDHYFGNTTLIATALGAVLGFAAGLYRFIRLAMAANRSAGPS